MTEERKGLRRGNPPPSVLGCTVTRAFEDPGFQCNGSLNLTAAFASCCKKMFFEMKLCAGGTARQWLYFRYIGFDAGAE
jgi:hypothetical protein